MRRLLALVGLCLAGMAVAASSPVNQPLPVFDGVSRFAASDVGLLTAPTASSICTRRTWSVHAWRAATTA